MAVLYIVRHGNTFDPGDTPRRIGRHTDLPLSSSGRTQASRLGDYLARADIAFTHIFAAPLKRTHETASAIAASMAAPAQITPEPSLLEIDYGPDENRPEEEVIARIGKDALEHWNNDATPPPGWNVDPTTLIESWRTLFTRVAAFGENATALAVTSNGVARFALDAADRIETTAPRKLRTGAFGRIEIDQGRAILTQWDTRP